MTPLMFRPDKKYLTKIYLEASLIGFIVIVTSGWLGYLVGRSEFGISMGSTGSLLGVLLNLIWILPAIVLINRYYHSLHYEIHEDEVIMHVGVITKTMKHVPFRTVTNIKVKRGPFDRLFSLGTIDIQTAGRSGESAAEESLVGLRNYRDVYDHVAQSLRNFRIVPDHSEEREHFPPQEGKCSSELLIELRSIRKILEDS